MGKRIAVGIGAVFAVGVIIILASMAWAFSAPIVKEQVQKAKDAVTGG